MYRSSLLAFFLTFIGVSDCLACSCFFEGGFFTVVKKADLILEGRVQTRGKNGSDVYFDIQVSEVYSNGDNVKNKQLNSVRVWADNGFQCRRSIKEFSEGNVWILALNKVKTKDALLQEFEISVCGEYAVERREETVRGVFRGKTMLPRQEMGYREFKSKLEAVLAGD